MFCPHCGKQIEDDDNFCRYCGSNLKKAVEVKAEKIEKQPVKETKVTPNTDDEEELVLYVTKKHFMSMFWPVFLTPLFLIYFWNIFLNTHSFLSWLVTIGMLCVIIYPVARYNSDKIIITNKCAHIKIGVLNPEELEIPLEKLDMIEVSQSSMGRTLDYGTASFYANSERFEYTYIQSPEELQYIIDNPKDFVKESLEEE